MGEILASAPTAGVNLPMEKGDPEPTGESIGRYCYDVELAASHPTHAPAPRRSDTEPRTGEQEDARRSDCELARPTKERTQHTNRVGSLFVLYNLRVNADLNLPPHWVGSASAPTPALAHRHRWARLEALRELANWPAAWGWLPRPSTAATDRSSKALAKLATSGWRCWWNSPGAGCAFNPTAIRASGSTSALRAAASARGAWASWPRPDGC